jgi:alkyl hydroperoxide reductase subunit D
MAQLEDLIAQIPDHSKDIKINIKNVLNSENSPLSEKQIMSTALACAIALKHPALIAAINEKSEATLDETELNAAKSAASIMGMNNIYYRFVHLSSNKEYGNIPAGLRMSVIANHGIDKTDFELYALAVSALNGCGMCIDSHEKILREHGIKTEQIQHAVKIAAVLNAVSYLV